MQEKTETIKEFLLEIGFGFQRGGDFLPGMF